MTGIYSRRPPAMEEHVREVPRVRHRSHSRSRIANEQFSPNSQQQQRHRPQHQQQRHGNMPQSFRRQDTSRVRRKEISMRLMKPTIVTIDLQLVMQLCRTWKPEYETDGVVYVHDEGLAQYQLVDVEAHHLFYAALALGKPSLRCTIVPDEPVDQLDQYGNTFAVNQQPRDSEEQKLLQVLMAALQKKGYKFRS